LLRKWRLIGLLAVFVLAFALLPAFAMGAPAITQGVQGIVKDASTGVPIPFAWMRISIDGGEYVYFSAEYDGTYSYATPVSDNIEVDANGMAYEAVNGPIIAVTAGAMTTQDFVLTRDPDFYQPVYRFFNMKGGTHFYTANDAEFIDVYKNNSSVFKYDGIAYWVAIGPDVAPEIGFFGWKNHSTVPLYRFFNVKTGVHFFTTDVAEMNDVKNNHSDLYTYEGVAYNVSGPEWGAPVYRFYNPKRNAHFYSVDSNEVRGKLSNYYHYEGIGFNTGGWEYFAPLPDGANPASVPAPNKGW